MENKKVLVLNSGSSSLKYSFEGQNGEIENPEKALDRFKDKEIDAIGHRIVFGGDDFPKPIVIDEHVMSNLRSLSKFAPLHMPNELSIVELFGKHFAGVPQVACFDTSFHRTIPKIARYFSINQELQKDGIKKFGFHGLSYESIVKQFDRCPDKMIVAHIGSGVSLCAIKGGESVDTSMGLTPLGGVMMGTRPGDLDPGVILYLLREKKISFDDLESLLYFKSGLRGMSGKSADIRELLEDKQEDVIDVFCYQIAKAIGAYGVALAGVDALVFTGGIGENSQEIRDRITDKIKSIGLSKDKIMVKPAQEEKMIERHVLSLV